MSLILWSEFLESIYKLVAFLWGAMWGEDCDLLKKVESSDK